MSTSSRPLILAARQSDLARLQAYRVGEALEKADSRVKVEYRFRASLGDINQSDPLWKMPEKGVFTEDFLKDLVEGTADFVVHSWKDLPTHPRPDTEIIATLPRADLRDLLLVRRDRLEDLARAPRTLRVLTSSPRRAYNLEPFLNAYLPFRIASASFETVRGNIPTRLRKLLAQDVDALVVAKAALDRLLAAPEAEFKSVQSDIRQVLSETQWMVLPLSLNPTAAAQGALAIEVAKSRDDLKLLFQKIHCENTFRAVIREREILAGYGGGCHQKIGVSVLERPFGRVRYLRGLTDAGETLDSILVESASVLPRAASKDLIFPRAGEEATFFERRTLPRESWQWAEAERFFWVARETAWPETFKPRSSEAIVWTAGLKTWKKLAERGQWVNGSSESLGESETAGIEILANVSHANWIKLSHADSQAFAASAEARLCATYKLELKSSHPVESELKGRTHFYWMSGSSFDRAKAQAPEILKGHHSCGPGHTLTHLQKELGPSANIVVFLNVDDWRRAILIEKATNSH